MKRGKKVQDEMARQMDNLSGKYTVWVKIRPAPGGFRFLKSGLFEMGKRDREAEAWIGKCRSIASRLACQHKLGPWARIIGLDVCGTVGTITVGGPGKTRTVRIPFVGPPEFLCALFGPLKASAKEKVKRGK